MNSYLFLILLRAWLYKINIIVFNATTKDRHKKRKYDNVDRRMSMTNEPNLMDKEIENHMEVTILNYRILKISFNNNVLF